MPEKVVTGSAWRRPELWSCHPQTGMLSLTELGMATIVNADPIEDWYIMDDEPMNRGQFAVVYQCRHRVTGRAFAAKFSQCQRRSADATAAIVHEIAVNAINCGAANVQLHEVFSTGTAYVLIMELATGGDLQSILDLECIPLEGQVASCMKQILNGLITMHSKDLVHMDIKPQNILLMGQFGECDVKLCDFDISKLLTPGYEIRDIQGTPDYVAPEVVCFEPITVKTDMWSFGVMVYSLLTGYLPFTGDDDTETFLNISLIEADFPKEIFEDVSADAIDFISKLLVRQPEARMSAEECLNHSWMKKGLDEAKPKTTIVCSQQDALSPSSTIIEEAEPNDDNQLVSKMVDSPSVKVIGRTKPPVHPHSSGVSLNAYTGDDSSTYKSLKSLAVHSTQLNKGSRIGSKQNLNKLRAITKSREALSERVQMLNIKKNLSKSRGRLYDSKISLSSSKENIAEHESVYQSMEALAALSKLHENGALYRSCNNIFVPKFKPRLSAAITNERMFRSNASIDQILRIGKPKVPGYFESKLCNEFNYTDMITRRNTDLNIVVDSSSYCNLKQNVSDDTRLGGLRANPSRGGRSAGSENQDESHCQDSCNQHHLEKNACLNNKSDRMKKDAQKRRKERIDRLNREQARHRKFSLGQFECTKPEEKQIENVSSPAIRRGSVCHVERRLQERHERLLEKQERLEKIKNTKITRRLSSTDSDHSTASDRSGKTTKSNTLPLPKERTRSVNSSRRRSNVYSPASSDVSQASSMESVISTTDNTVIRIKHAKSKPNKIDAQTRRYDQVCTSNSLESQNEEQVPEAPNSTRVAEVKDVIQEADEAYVSLEDETKDCIEQSSTPERSVTFVDATSRKDEPTLGALLGDEKYQESQSVGTNSTEDYSLAKSEPQNDNRSESHGTSYNLFESQHGNVTDTTKMRSKSVCVQPKLDLCLISPMTRNRSNSVEKQPEYRPTEWRELCTGSIAKALRNFAVPEESPA